MESNSELQANEAAQQTQPTESEENLIVSNFVSFFQPLIQNLDAHVESLRLGLFIFFANNTFYLFCMVS